MRPPMKFQKCFLSWSVIWRKRKIEIERILELEIELILELEIELEIEIDIKIVLHHTHQYHQILNPHLPIPIQVILAGNPHTTEIF